MFSLQLNVMQSGCVYVCVQHILTSRGSYDLFSVITHTNIGSLAILWWTDMGMAKPLFSSHFCVHFGFV